MTKPISARFSTSVSLSKKDADLLNALRSKNIQTVEVFRRGLIVLGQEQGLLPVDNTEK